MTVHLLYSLVVGLVENLLGKPIDVDREGAHEDQVHDDDHAGDHYRSANNKNYKFLFRSTGIC